MRWLRFKLPRFMAVVRSACVSLFLVIAGLAIKSYFQGDYLAWARTREYHLESVHGSLHLWTTVERQWHPGAPFTYFLPQYLLDGPELPSRPMPPWPKLMHTSQRNWSFDMDQWSYLGVRYGSFFDL